MCGGLGYINIFHTDAHKTTIDDFGCGATAQDTYYQKWFTDMGHCNISTTGAPASTTTTGIFSFDILLKCSLFHVSANFGIDSRNLTETPICTPMQDILV